MGFIGRFWHTVVSLWKRRGLVFVVGTATTLCLSFLARAFGDVVLDVARSRIAAMSKMSSNDFWTQIILCGAAGGMLIQAALFWVWIRVVAEKPLYSQKRTLKTEANEKKP